MTKTQRSRAKKDWPDCEITEPVSFSSRSGVACICCDNGSVVAISGDTDISRAITSLLVAGGYAFPVLKKKA